MTRRRVLDGIFTDDGQNQAFLEGLSPEQWHQGVADALALLAQPPCATSKPILEAIAASGMTVTIIPSDKRALGPDKIFGNAAAEPTTPRQATALGRPTEADPSATGLGGGSNSVLQFVAQDWDPAATGASFKAVDEVLLHELVHALRQNLGQEDNSELIASWKTSQLAGATRANLMSGSAPPPTALTQIYENLEEFAAILITNIYRAENLRTGLVRDHLGPSPRRGEPKPKDGQPFRDPREETRSLGYPLTNPRNFLTMWQKEIARLFTELSVSSTAQKISTVRCGFNPFFELVLARTKPKAGSWAH